MFRDGKQPTKWGQSLGGGEKIGRVFELHWRAWHPATLPPGVISSHLSLPPNISIVLERFRACFLLYRCFLSVFLMIEASTGNWRWFHHSRHLWLWPLSSCWQGFFFKKSSDFIWDYQSLGDDAFLPLPPREILNKGQVILEVKQNLQSVPDASTRPHHWLQPRRGSRGHCRAPKGHY